MLKTHNLRLITIFYIILPSFLFALGWLKGPFSIFTLLILLSFAGVYWVKVYPGVGGGKVSGQKDENSVLSVEGRVGFVLVFFMLLLWLAFSGTGGLGLQNADYKASNALLKALIEQDWPLTYVIEGVRVPIVYYFAYYLPAALVGKLFGWLAANIFLFGWTFVGVWLSFAWFWKLSRSTLRKPIGKLLILALIFCLAGGMDFVGAFLLKGREFEWSAHIEWWAEFFQYSSNTTLIYWVPQHTLAAWLITGLIADALYEKHSLIYMGMVMAAGVLWSPFGIVGTAPYLLWLGVVYLQTPNRKYLFNRESLVFNILSLWLAAVHLLFLGSNQFKFPMGFIWQFAENQRSLLRNLLAFWGLEFALIGGVTLVFLVAGVFFSRARGFKASWDQRFLALEREFGIVPLQLALFGMSFAVLWILPLFKLGYYNDIVMRGSIPSFFIFWTFLGKVITAPSFRVRIKFSLFHMLIVMLLLVSFFPSLAGIVRSVNHYRFGPPALSEVLSIAEANQPEIIQQRVGDETSIFFRYFGK